MAKAAGCIHPNLPIWRRCTVRQRRGEKVRQGGDVISPDSHPHEVAWHVAAGKAFLTELDREVLSPVLPEMFSDAEAGGKGNGLIRRREQSEGTNVASERLLREVAGEIPQDDGLLVTGELERDRHGGKQPLHKEKLNIYTLSGKAE